jgi:hypothetical protein
MPVANRAAAQIFNNEEILWRCVMLHPFNEPNYAA